MGVTGLWKLIEPCGKPVPVETLEGKILAVDISVWLHQVVKGFQDNKGAALNNAHLLGLFHRLCKLLYYRVKPVFVFDGCVPQLKKDTIARRQQQRSKLNNEADRIQALLLQSLAKEKVVQQALGPNAELLLTSPIKKTGTNKGSRKEDSLDDMFKLPELPCGSNINPYHTEDEGTDESINENSVCSEHYTTMSTTDSSFEEPNSRHAYNLNIQAIDVRSKEFVQLPADVRHEILVDIKETRKQSSWGRLHELPSRSDDFSNFQMKRLLKRRDVQVSLESAEQEMGGHTLTYAELTNIFSEEGILETDIVEKGTKQITSDEHTRFLLVKDLKKKLAKVKEEAIKEEKAEVKEEKNCSETNTTKNDETPSAVKDDKKLGNEYESDLELAIALSLEDDSNKVYDEKDYEYDSDESLKLSKDQRQQLQNAAKGPARSYMMEYAGMNKEEVAGILEKTQIKADLNDTLDIERLIGDAIGNANEERKLNEVICKEKITNNESQDIRLCVTDDSDSTDSDLEEVEDPDNNIMSNEELNKVILPKIIKTKLSDIEEINDSDPTDEDLEKVGDDNVGKLKNRPCNKAIELEEECVIEETPPCLADEEEVKSTTSKTLNIQIDLTKPLQPEDDIFADLFEDVATEEKIVQETPTFREDTEYLKGETSTILKENTENSKSFLNDGKQTKEIEHLHFKEDKTKIQFKTLPKNEKILSILDELKQQADEIKNIKLENIKIDDPITEISDDEVALMAPEIIEICDSDDNEKRPTTPPPQIINAQSPKINPKSPNFRTPSKNHTITEFYDVNYVVKRTPDKHSEEDNESVPKVKSPFFVHKTPKSARKTCSTSPSPNKKSLKANKNLFDQNNETSPKTNEDTLDNDFIPLKESKTSNEEDIINEAANILKSQKTAEELNTIASDLAKERRELENERNRQDRMGMSITQRMNSDCQDLLRLFGIPFIVAPMEAEAQCAFLDLIHLTNGTITDDSDIWLFGGRTVYKNFFAQNKHVMEFRAEQIEQDFSCDRKKLIQLACLVGSDYTTGIHGIGAVTALEILASFTPKEPKDKQDDLAATHNILATLQRFRNWWQAFKSSVAPPGSSARLALQKKLKNIEMYEGFPSTAVVEAYLTPKVDENKDAFTWGYPDVDSLKEFARKNFGWTTNKTDEILIPVLKKLNEKRTQQSIRNYFNVKNALSLRQIRVSKRVKNAIEKMSGSIDTEEMGEKPTKAKRARKSNISSSRKKTETLAKDLDTEMEQVSGVSLTFESSCSNQIIKGPVKRTSKRVNIPETIQIIPQREKDLAQMEANKKLAAEILKKSAKEPKRKCKA